MELPVVASALPGNAELLAGDRGEAALIEPRDDVEGYAKALARLARDPSLAEAVGRELRARTLERFSLQRMADEHAALYEKVIADRPEPQGDLPHPEPLRFRNRPLEGTPLVSVIVPHFNQSAVLGDCIDSVWAQTYPEIELIVVDDASTEAEAEEVLVTLEAHEDVKLVRQEHNGGPSKARNRAIKESSGRYVLPVDADNVLLPEAVEKLVEQLSAGRRRRRLHLPEPAVLRQPRGLLRGARIQPLPAAARQLLRHLLADRPRALRGWRVLQRGHLPRPRGLGVRAAAGCPRGAGRGGARPDRQVPQMGLQPLRRGRALARAVRGRGWPQSGFFEARYPRSKRRRCRPSPSVAFAARPTPRRHRRPCAASLRPDLSRHGADLPLADPDAAPDAAPRDAPGPPPRSQPTPAEPSTRCGCGCAAACERSPPATVARPARRPGLLREGAAALHDLRAARTRSPSSRRGTRGACPFQPAPPERQVRATAPTRSSGAPPPRNVYPAACTLIPGDVRSRSRASSSAPERRSTGISPPGRATTSARRRTTSRCRSPSPGSRAPRACLI